MDKILKLYTYVDGVNDTPFPSAEEPIEIGAFRYDAKRMGGAPIITASVNYPSCLDNEWTDSVYASFNGEKYYLKQTPTSSYDNVDTMYKHDLELVSERVILDDVYFFDAVVGNPQDEDKPVSNSTKVVFFGDVREFVARLNSSLEYSGLDYTVVVDDDIVTEEKLMSFEDQFFSNVLQEIYNTYEVPYYFEGKTIHIGNSLPLGEDEEIPTFAYGVDDALLSITKNNANQKVVNRMTGTGSEDNIPFYYPNNSAKGDIAAISSRDGLKVKIIDSEKFGSAVDIDGTITFRNAECELSSVEVLHSNFTGLDSWYSKGFYDSMESEEIVLKLDVSTIGQKSVRFGIDVKSIRDANENLIEGANYSVQWALLPIGYSSNPTKTWLAREASQIVELPKMGLNNVYLRATIRFVDATGAPLGSSLHYADLKFSISLEDSEGWEYKEKMYDLKDLGLSVSSGTPISGDTITQTLIKYIKTSQNLMPSVYRATDGAERFYNAINYPFLAQDGYELQYGEYFKKEDKDGNPSDVNYVHNDIYKEADGTYIHFNNPYVEGRPKEHIITDENIKPTIKEALNSTGLRMDMFSEFAYDLDDNDELIENEEGNEHEYVHSYFFGKLRKLDFNLFDHAIEQQPMTISFTSGDCGACNFEIGVTEEFPQKNPVQVNADGTLKRDEKGRVICGQFEDITEDECQPEQQDTINNEVWIALKKEDTTYGILMPKAVVYEEDGITIKEAGHRPKACTQGQNDGDTFVILGINLPKPYILNAEKKVEAAIIKGLKENNDEKFTFSITFSRIYFEENPDVLAYLSENSKIAVTYNNETYDLYVSSYSYNMGEGEVLPEIRVELDDTLKVSQNVLQNAINQVKSELGRVVNNIDVAGAVAPYFLRKDVDDEAQGKINFAKGIKFGEGGKVEVLDNNSAKLTIEYLEVTKKASFTSLEIQEKTHVGGQILVTPAAINCGEVEELDDAYRCYFQTMGADGDEIFNQFAVGDQAICQTYNAWGSVYYWRLVTGVGEDYIDLSKTDCDEDSGIPKAGDKIIQLGNRGDVERQNAIVIAAYGDGSPYIIQYKGINSFDIGDDKIVTKLSSTENIFTGKVHMEMGSDGVENLNLEIGGQNLLRNSGFTGDYLSEQLADDKVLEAAAELYSSPLDHWQDAGNVNVVDSTRTTSGKEIELDGVLSQNLFYKTELGASYVLSFMAKGEGSIIWTLGTQKTTIELGTEWAKYESTIEATSSSVIFTIEGQGEVIIGDIKLEKGNKATSWSASPLDNTSDRAYYQSMKYIQNAFEGATDIGGGLVLTEQIQVGDYDADKKEWVKMNGGMSGVYESDHDVAFWSGGDFNQAIETVMKYADDPTFQPTEEQLASMANFVVTHGGRAILNDAIIRGTIYAKDGSFEGEIKANKGNFGDFNLISSEIYGDAALEGAKEYDTEVHKMTIRPDYFEIQAYDTYGEEVSHFESIRISPLAYGDRYDVEGIIDLHAQKGFAAINIGQGQVRGLRHDVLSTESDSVTLYSFSPYIIILSSSATVNKFVSLPVDPEVGTTFQIINAYHSPIIISSESGFKTFNIETKTIDDTTGWNESAPYKIDAYFDGNMWYICPTIK